MFLNDLFNSMKMLAGIDMHVLYNALIFWVLMFVHSAIVAMPRQQKLFCLNFTFLAS